MVISTYIMERRIKMANISIDYSAFRENLRRLVEGTSKTQAEVAEELGMSAPTLNRYLVAKRTPDLPYVVQIANHFNVSIDWLLGLNGDKYNVMPKEVQEIADLYQAATKDDRRVVEAVLNKYKGKPFLPKEDDNQ